MDIREFMDAYREECARGDEGYEQDVPRTAPASVSYKTKKINTDDWRFRQEMKWADQLDADFPYPED